MALECFVWISNNSLSWLSINSRCRQQLRHSSFEALKMNMLRLVALLLMVLSAQANIIRKPEAVRNPVQISRPKGESSHGGRKPIHFLQPKETVEQGSQVAGNPDQSVEPKVEDPSVISPVQPTIGEAIDIAQPNVVDSGNAVQQPIVQQENVVPPVAESTVQSQLQSVEEPVNSIPQIASNPEQLTAQKDVIPQAAEKPVEPEQPKAELTNNIVQETKIPEQPVETSNVEQASNEVVQDVAKDVVVEKIPEESKLSNLVASEVLSQVVEGPAQKVVKPAVEETEAGVGGNLEGSDIPVVEKVQAEPRSHFGYNIENPGAPKNNSNTLNHTHTHYYVKPALLPIHPFFGGFLPPNGTHDNSNHHGHLHNKYSNFHGYPVSFVPPSINISDSSYAKPVFMPLPLLPIPFWKGDNDDDGNYYNKYNNTNHNKYNNSNTNHNDTNHKPHKNHNQNIYNFKPFYPFDYSKNANADYFLDKPRAHPGSDAHPQQVREGLQLIGHIYIYKAPETSVNPRPDIPPTSADILEGTEETNVKVDEPFGNSQLLLQPVVYPGNNNKDDGANQITEIYRSLHVVHPSVQQRSQSAVQSDDSSVLFAVEIPKPIYRFFKSIFGAFSY